MAANLGLVAHTAERQAHEVASRGPRDGLGQRCLAHARRSHQTQDGALLLAYQSLHRQVLQDAFLHLLQAEVVLVEDALGLRHVKLVFGARAPGQSQHPVDVVAHHRRLGRHGRHQAQLSQFLLDPGRCLFGQLDLAGPFLQLGELVLELVAFPCFLLGRVELLGKNLLLLTLVHLAAHARAQLALVLQNLDLGAQELGQAQ